MWAIDQVPSGMKKLVKPIGEYLEPLSRSRVQYAPLWLITAGMVASSIRESSLMLRSRT